MKANFHLGIQINLEILLEFVLNLEIINHLLNIWPACERLFLEYFNVFIQAISCQH